MPRFVKTALLALPPLPPPRAVPSVAQRLSRSVAAAASATCSGNTVAAAAGGQDVIGGSSRKATATLDVAAPAARGVTLYTVPPPPAPLPVCSCSSSRAMMDCMAHSIPPGSHHVRGDWSRAPRGLVPLGVQQTTQLLPGTRPPPPRPYGQNPAAVPSQGGWKHRRRRRQRGRQRGAGLPPRPAALPPSAAAAPTPLPASQTWPRRLRRSLGCCRHPETGSRGLIAVAPTTRAGARSPVRPS